jgi:hydrogenase expression/formation protein HypD
VHSGVLPCLSLAFTSYKVPFVVTGLEPIDLLEGMLTVVRQLGFRRAITENQASRVNPPLHCKDHR